MIDYEDLLRRYIQHVSECEGVIFISCIGDSYCTMKFSDDEVGALLRLANDRGVKPGRP